VSIHFVFEIRWGKNTTLSEQFQNTIKKITKRGKSDIPTPQKYMIAHFPGLIQEILFVCFGPMELLLKCLYQARKVCDHVFLWGRDVAFASFCNFFYCILELFRQCGIFSQTTLIVLESKQFPFEVEVILISRGINIAQLAVERHMSL
jgi:hypothetical protein